jgi:hypothetical protein
MKPRNALWITVLFATIATVYGIVSRDVGGATMLGALGVGMGLMGYVLLAGVRDGS